MRAPFWQVMSVFDPDGTGSDFAYTIGLAERGHPELHVWARPTDGDDPGADFRFSMRDMGLLLNGWAAELLEGRLEPGQVRSLELDGGSARAVFTVGEPVHPSHVDAYAVAVDARVLPMRWRLERPPVGTSVPLDVDETAELIAAVQRLGEAAAGCSLPLSGRPASRRPLPRSTSRSTRTWGLDRHSSGAGLRRWSGLPGRPSPHS